MHTKYTLYTHYIHTKYKQYILLEARHTRSTKPSHYKSLFTPNSECTFLLVNLLSINYTYPLNTLLITLTIQIIPTY